MVARVRWETAQCWYEVVLVRDFNGIMRGQTSLDKGYIRYLLLDEMPEMHLFRDDPALQTFYDAMCERPSTPEILAAKELELKVTKKELFGGFGAAYLNNHIGRRIRGGLFGREV